MKRCYLVLAVIATIMTCSAGCHFTMRLSRGPERLEGQTNFLPDIAKSSTILAGVVARGSVPINSTGLYKIIVADKDGFCHWEVTGDKSIKVNDTVFVVRLQVCQPNDPDFRVRIAIKASDFPKFETPTAEAPTVKSDSKK